MLVLTRKEGEQIQIGDDVTITVVRLNNGQVRLGIEAPKSTPVLRSELKFRTRSPAAKLTVSELTVSKLTANVDPYQPVIPVQYAACGAY
ncbi:MAG: carbon storage regulator CsrA [Planctomycetaceae bacterium]|nr:carbon storage regulator CsrA [Planctomycetaceae bacterium]